LAYRFKSPSLTLGVAETAHHDIPKAFPDLPHSEPLRTPDSREDAFASGKLSEYQLYLGGIPRHARRAGPEMIDQHPLFAKGSDILLALLDHFALLEKSPSFVFYFALVPLLIGFVCLVHAFDFGLGYQTEIHGYLVIQQCGN
jgi:hypothetical protein